VRNGAVGTRDVILRRLVGERCGPYSRREAGAGPAHFGRSRTRGSILGPTICGRRGARNGVFPIQRRTLGCVAILVAVTQVKPNKGSFTIRIVAMIDLLRIMVQLVSIPKIKVSSCRI